MSKTNTDQKPTKEIKHFLPLYDHAKATADLLGHPHTLTQKEWDASNPPHTGQAVVARFGTWRKFIRDNAGIDAESREYDKQYDIMCEIVNECLDKLEAAKVFEKFDCSRDQLDSAISGYLTGVF
jgi:hypothetical protein